MNKPEIKELIQDDQKLREFIISKLTPFMMEFERNNATNRISPELVQGFGTRLENYIFSVVQEAMMQDNESAKVISPNEVTKG